MLKQIDGLRGINNEVFVFENSLYTYAESVKYALSSVDYRSANIKDNIILDCYASATIEGAETSIGKVKKALKSNVVEDKSTKMVINCLKAITFILNSSINVDTLLTCWRIIVDSVCENECVRGTRFRDGMVYVGKHTPENPNKIEDAMLSLLNYLKLEEDCFIKACVAHFYFVYIHPFCDGNGRFARILFDKVLYDNGYSDIFNTPLSNVIMNHKSQYYKAISLSETSIKGYINISPFIAYMLQILTLGACTVADSRHSELEVRVYNLVSKHKGAELSVTKCSKLLNISEDIAESVLNIMVEKGTLIKYANNNKYLYRINCLNVEF